MRVKVDHGKYEVIYNGGRLHALRHGQEWRDCVGDNLIFHLAFELSEARSKVSELEAKLGNLQDSLRSCYNSSAGALNLPTSDSLSQKNR